MHNLEEVITLDDKYRVQAIVFYDNSLEIKSLHWKMTYSIRTQGIVLEDK